MTNRPLSSWDRMRNAQVVKERRDAAFAAIKSLRRHRASGICRPIDLAIITLRVKEALSLYRITMRLCGPHVTTYGPRRTKAERLGQQRRLEEYRGY